MFGVRLLSFVKDKRYVLRYSCAAVLRGAKRIEGSTGYSASDR